MLEEWPNVTIGPELAQEHSWRIPKCDWMRRIDSSPSSQPQHSLSPVAMCRPHHLQLPTFGHIQPSLWQTTSAAVDIVCAVLCMQGLRAPPQ